MAGGWQYFDDFMGGPDQPGSSLRNQMLADSGAMGGSDSGGSESASGGPPPSGQPVQPGLRELLLHGTPVQGTVPAGAPMPLYPPVAPRDQFHTYYGPNGEMWDGRNGPAPEGVKWLRNPWPDRATQHFQGLRPHVYQRGQFDLRTVNGVLSAQG